MASSRFTAGMLGRAGGLFLTLAAIAWMVAHTQWYVTIALFAAAAIAQIALFIQFASASDREIARFLDAIAFDDPSQNFNGLRHNGAFRDLGTAMSRVMERLRASRTEREEQ